LQPLADNWVMLATPQNFVLIPATSAQWPTETGTLKLCFRGHELLVTDTGVAPCDPVDIDASGDAIVVGRWNGQLVVTKAHAIDTPAPVGARWAGIRSLFGVMADDLVAIAGRAGQLLEWDRSHKHCGACAAPTERDAHERVRRCPACNLASYPRISPAMMCLVTRGKQILLARNVNFPLGRYSALAGFLEAGESIEDAVHREVREEVGVEVDEPKYFASQSWPFPNSLMIAFTAEYVGGELKPDGHEIVEAGWFDAGNLPQLPPRISIARALIDDTVLRLRNASA